eukprot:3973421-Prorocentrum_lima.AAC.1
MFQQEDQEVRREKLYLPKATQDGVKKSFEHGFGNPAAGGLKSVPVTCKEVADRSGEAMLEWIASINSEMQNFRKLEGLQQTTQLE